MAYTKTTWQTGDVITAPKLNNAENGIETVSSPLFISGTDRQGTLNVTAQELYDAWMSNRRIILRYRVSDEYVNTYGEVFIGTFNTDNIYVIVYIGDDEGGAMTPLFYTASTMSDYLVPDQTENS